MWSDSHFADQLLWYLPERSCPFARVLTAAGRIDKAIAEAQQALQLAPDDVDSWTEMGFIFLAAERFEDARNAFDRVAELTARDPRIVGALMDGAEAFAMTGMLAEVPSGLDELAGQDPVRLSMYLASLGRREGVLTAFVMPWRVTCLTWRWSWRSQPSVPFEKISGS